MIFLGFLVLTAKAYLSFPTSHTLETIRSEKYGKEQRAILGATGESEDASATKILSGKIPGL